MKPILSFLLLLLCLSFFSTTLLADNKTVTEADVGTHISISKGDKVFSGELTAFYNAR